MLYESLDDVSLVTGSIGAAVATFERLGFRVGRPRRQAGTGLEYRAICAGGATNLFWVLLTGVIDTQEAEGHRLGRFVSGALQKSPGVFRLGLRVSSLKIALQELASRGVQVESYEFFGADGAKLGDIAPLPASDAACATLALVQYVKAQPERHAALEASGALAHALPLKRLDHLAAVSPDLEATTRYWNDVLGIPTWGEVVTPTTIIRQMKVGDAILELLGPANADSPIRSRAPGLSSMTAFEVPDLNAAVAIVRSAGFGASDPVVGSLPGTRVARIPAEELSGLALQLLEYV